MSNGAKWTVGAVLLILLWAAGAQLNFLGAGTQRAETRLQDAASEALRAVAGDALSVRLDGQRAILSGDVRRPEALAQARAAVLQAGSLGGVGAGGVLWGGVTAVDDAGVRVKPPRSTPYEWSAQWDGRAVTLSGHAPSAADRNILLARARTLFAPGTAVRDAMSVDADAPHGQWTAMAMTGLEALAALRRGRAGVRDVTLSLSGEAPNADAEAAARRALATINGAFEVDGRQAQARATVSVRPDRRLAPQPTPTPTPTQTPAQTPGPEPTPPTLRPSITQTPQPTTTATPAPTAAPTGAAAPRAAAARRCQSALDTALDDQSIGFESASAALQADASPLLTALARIAAACPQARIRVAGHTDNTGAEALNERLSAARAEAVAEALIARGVAADRLDTVGYGAARPRAANDTPEGRARNRRIEITVLQDASAEGAAHDD